MNIKLFALLAALFTFSLHSFAEDAPQEVLDLVPELEKMGTNPVLVAAVKAQNAKSMSLFDIQARDATWKATTGVDGFMKAIMENPAAIEMLNLEKNAGYIAESFLMDNQGANVAMTNKTSDYWQGDEAKWKESFKGGAGGVHVSEVKFDESSQNYLVQISIAIKDGDSVIGAMTIGINLDEL